MTTHKERMLAAMRGEMVEVIPFVPRLDLWWLANSLGGTLPFYDRYRLGGLFRLSGYDLSSVTGQYAGIAALLYYVRLADLARGLGAGVYAGLSIEAGNAWEERSAASFGDLRYAASAYLGADTIFGPVYLAYGRGESGTDAFYLYVGRSF